MNRSGHHMASAGIAEYAASMEYAQLIYARIIDANASTTSTHNVRALVY